MRGRDVNTSVGALFGILVDDEGDFAAVTASLLEERLADRGLIVQIKPCASPEEARRTIDGRRARGGSVDLVLTDMLFPPVGQPNAPPNLHVPRGGDVISWAKDAGVR